MEDFKLKGKVVLDDTGFSAGLDKLKSQGKEFGQSFTNSMFGAVTAANLATKCAELLVSVMRSAVNEFALFDEKLAKVNTLLDQQVLSTTNLRMELLRVSSATGIYASELANASYEALSAGVETQNLTSFIEDMTTLAQGGFTSVTAAVDVTTSIMNAYGKEVYSVKEISDKLIKTQAQGKVTVDELSRTLYNVIPIASSLGVSLDEVLASVSLITKSGTPAAQATTQVRQALADLTDEATGAGKKFKEITGKTFPDFVKAGGTLNEAIKILGEYSKQANIPLTNIFSRIEAGQGALILAADEAKNFSKEIDGIKKSTGEAEKAQKIATENMAQQWKKLATELTNKFISDEAGVFTLMNKAVFELSKNVLQFLTYDSKKGMLELEKNFTETSEKINKLRRSLGLETIEHDITKQSLDKLKEELAQLESENYVRKVYYEAQSGFGGQEMEADYEAEAEARAKAVWEKRKAEIAAKAEEDKLAEAKAESDKKAKELAKANREAERAARDKFLLEDRQYNEERNILDSEFKTSQLEKDIEFFNQISEMRNNNWVDEMDIDQAYQDYQYEKFLAEQEFRLEQLEADRAFYEGKKEYAADYANTLAAIKELEAQSIEKALDREEQLRNRDLSFTQRVNKSKEQLIKGAYSTIIQTNDNMLKALSKFFLDSIGNMMMAHGAELLYTGIKDVAKGIAISANPATPGMGAPLIAAGKNEIAQSALFAVGAGAMKAFSGATGVEGGSGGDSTSIVPGTSSSITEQENMYSSLEKEKTVTVYTDGDMKEVFLAMYGTIKDLAQDFDNINLVSR